MAEYRLAKVAGELNRSFTALAEFLKQKGFDVEARPTTKINEDMYQACLQEFSADKAAKEAAQKKFNKTEHLFKRKSNAGRPPNVSNVSKV